MEKRDAPPEHIVRLDVVRGTAFLAVYFYHLSGAFKRGQIPWDGNFRDYSVWPREALPLLPFAFGWIGVALFFVVSGFCIHYGFLRRGTGFSARDFFWRRFLRLYPAYFVALIVFACLSHWLPFRYFNVWQVILHVALLHNFIHATFMGINPSFWSLGVEADFYLLFPVLLFGVARWGMQRSLAIALALNVIADLYFTFTHRPPSPVHPSWSFPLVTWCDWILGAALAEAYVEGRRLFIREKTWLVVSGLLLFAALETKTLCAQTYLFAAVFFTVALQRYLAWKSPLLKVERALVPIGIISYSLYLWHQPMISLINSLGASLKMTGTPLRHLAWDLSVTTATVALLGCASYVLLEVRAPRVIRNFMARHQMKAPPLPGAAAVSPLSRSSDNDG